MSGSGVVELTHAVAVIVTIFRNFLYYFLSFISWLKMDLMDELRGDRIDQPSGKTLQLNRSTLFSHI